LVASGKQLITTALNFKFFWNSNQSN